MTYIIPKAMFYLTILCTIQFNNYTHLIYELNILYTDQNLISIYLIFVRHNSNIKNMYSIHKNSKFKLHSCHYAVVLAIQH